MNVINGLIEIHKLIEDDILNLCVRPIKDYIDFYKTSKEFKTTLNYHLKINRSGLLDDNYSYHRNPYKTADVSIQRDWLNENIIYYEIGYYPKFFSNIVFIYDYEHGTLKIKDKKPYLSVYRSGNKEEVEILNKLFLESPIFEIELDNIEDFIMIETLSKGRLNMSELDGIVQKLKDTRINVK